MNPQRRLAFLLVLALAGAFAPPVFAPIAAAQQDARP